MIIPCPFERPPNGNLQRVPEKKIHPRLCRLSIGTETLPRCQMCTFSPDGEADVTASSQLIHHNVMCMIVCCDTRKSENVKDRDLWTDVMSMIPKERILLVVYVCANYWAAKLILLNWS
jgi:hypothetical protein